MKNLFICLMLLCFLWGFTACAKDAVPAITHATEAQSAALPASETTEPTRPYSGSEGLVLFHGIALDEQHRNYTVERPEYADNFLMISALYNGAYKVYANGRLIETAEYSVEERGYDYDWWIPTEGEIALKGDIDLYPRLYTLTDTEYDGEKAVIASIEATFGVRTAIQCTMGVDLDDDGAPEYILHAQSAQQDSHYVCLTDSDFNIISYLLACTASDFALPYDLEGDTEVVDVDGDGVLEVVVRMFAYEGFLFNVYKYNQGTFSGGEYVNVCHVMP